MEILSIALSPNLTQQNFTQPRTGLPMPDFVDLATMWPTIKLDVKYATPQNFVGSVIYTAARAFLLKTAADDFLAAVKEFEALGYGVIVYDAYRPFHAQQKMFEAYPYDGFVADPRKGGRHTRGVTLDISLYDLKTKAPLVMPTDFDSFDVKAAALAGLSDGLTQEQYDNKMQLIRVMNKHHFTVVKNEWWHFDHTSILECEPMDYAFDQIALNLKQDKASK